MTDLLTSAEANVFYFAMITAIATGLGAIPFFIFKNLTRRWLGISNAVASGLMLAASFGLIYEGLNYDLWMTIGGIFAGLVFITISQKILDRYNNISIAKLNRADASKMLLIIGVMTIHSFTEGVSVGVSFSGGMDLGLFISTAIAIHNIPEGLAISLVMVPRGSSPFQAMLWSIFSSLPQPLMAVPAYLFVEIFEQYLSAGLGFAGGAMIWMVFAELVPDALEDAHPRTVALTVTISVALMIAFQVLIE